ncbi:MAG: DUF63 family protein [Candidatus Altiarchaeota archaeon]
MFESFSDFLYRYFFVPGYDVVDTTTYGVALGLIVFYLIPRIKRFGVGMDREFILALMPFVFYGATTRELLDHRLGVYYNFGVYPQNFFLVSPWIYFTMFILTSLFIVAGLFLERRFGLKHTRFVFFGGCLLALYNIYLIVPAVESISPLFYVSGLFVLSSGLFFIIVKSLKLEYMMREFNYMIAMAHLFDASTTFFGVDFLGNVEQHVVPNFFIGLTGTAGVMYPLKILVLLPALYIIDKDMKDDVFGRRFVKLVILVLGLGPGVRNTILMLLG